MNQKRAEFVGVLAEALLEFPALRIGQLIINSSVDGDIYYTEDDRMTDNLRKYINEHK